MENSFRLKPKATGVSLLLVFFLLVMMSSCSNNDYVNAIPSTATAIVKVDASKLGADGAAAVVESLLPGEDVADCGIDWSSNLYVFETVDGNFGICAKVSSESKLSDTLEGLASDGKCGKLHKQGDFTFLDINNVWAAGYSDKAIVILGPVSTAELPDAKRNILRMLRQDEDAGIKSSNMFEKLDSIESAVGMVARVDVLPEKFVAPFTIGAPKGADASQIFVAVNFSKKDGVVCMNGETFSFNRSVNAALKKASASYRKINGDYLNMLPNDCQMGLFTNVDGCQFLPMLQSNKSLQALLVGINTAVDFDNIMRSVNGDLVFATDGIMSDKMDLTMYAKVKNPQWVADVDYWKQSCSAGTSITGTSGAWVYNSGNMHFAFGLSNDMFYGTTDNRLIPGTASKDAQPLPANLQNMVRGNRMVLLLNIGGIINGTKLPDGISGIVQHMLGDVKSVAYILQ